MCYGVTMNWTMYKVVFFAKKKEGWDDDEFYEHYEEEHVPLAKELPGIQRYTYGKPIDPDSEWDLTANLYWETQAELQEAFESEEMQTVVEDGATFTDQEAETSVTVEEEVVLER